MNNHKNIPLIVREIPVDGIQKVFAALEGDWNSTMVTIWTRDKGLLGFSKVTRTHSTFKPSIELYLEDTWLGIHCYKKINGKNVFDEEFAINLLEYLETKCEMSKL
jgi:hypothetical protein